PVANSPAFQAFRPSIAVKSRALASRRQLAKNCFDSSPPAPKSIRGESNGGYIGDGAALVIERGVVGDERGSGFEKAQRTISGVACTIGQTTEQRWSRSGGTLRNI